jgi:hypothetical protein
MWVNDRMEECRARRQVLILDCCFSSAFARGAKSAEAFGLDQFTEPGRGRAVLTASNATECSFETPITGQPTPDSPAPGSIFTRPFLAGLRDGSADRDGDGFVTVDEAYAYAYQQLRASGAAQTPQRWLSGGEGQLLLARNPAGLVVIPAALPDSLSARHWTARGPTSASAPSRSSATGLPPTTRTRHESSQRPANSKPLPTTARPTSPPQPTLPSNTPDRSAPQLAHPVRLPSSPAGARTSMR